MVTRITRVVPTKVEGIRSGEGIQVEIHYNAEHPGLRLAAVALTPHFSAAIEGGPAEAGERNRLATRLVLTREPQADGCECMVEFVLGHARPFQVLFSLEKS